jgi:hypothetical protein
MSPIIPRPLLYHFPLKRYTKHMYGPVDLSWNAGNPSVLIHRLTVTAGTSKHLTHKNLYA